MNSLEKAIVALFYAFPPAGIEQCARRVRDIVHNNPFCLVEVVGVDDNGDEVD